MNQCENQVPVNNFTMIPNIVSHLGLDVYQRALYFEIARIAGQNHACFMNNKNLAELCDMSEKKLRLVKKSLELPMEKLGGKALIKVIHRVAENGGKTSDLITVTNIWPENSNYFKCGIACPPSGTTYRTPRYDIPNPLVQGTDKKEHLNKNNLEKDIYAAEPVNLFFGGIFQTTQERYDQLISSHGKECVDKIIKCIDRHCKARGVEYKDYFEAFHIFLDRQEEQKKDRETLIDKKAKIGNGFCKTVVDRRVRNVDGTVAENNSYGERF